MKASESITLRNYDGGAISLAVAARTGAIHSICARISYGRAQIGPLMRRRQRQSGRPSARVALAFHFRQGQDRHISAFITAKQFGSMNMQSGFVYLKWGYRNGNPK